MKEAPASKVNSGREMFFTIGVAESGAGDILLSVQNNHSGKTETYSLLRKDWARLVSETPRLDELMASPSPFTGAPSWHVEDNLTHSRIGREHANWGKAAAVAYAMNMDGGGWRYGVYDQDGKLCG